MSTIVVTPPAAAARVARGEALPLGAARLVDVHVGVDQAGQQDHVVAELDHLGRVEAGARAAAGTTIRTAVGADRQRLDRDDPAVGDADAAGPLSAGRDHPPPAQDQVQAAPAAHPSCSRAMRAPTRSSRGPGRSRHSARSSDSPVSG